MNRTEDIAPSSAVLGSLSDELLMASMVKGDVAAFAILYRRHQRAAVALALHLCSRLAVAEEIVQEAFLSFWRSRQRYDSARGSVRTWILGIVRNRAIDVLRQGIAQEISTLDEQGRAESLQASELTEREFGQRERARQLRTALDGLPPEQGLVISLAYYGGYSHSEIAAMLGTPVGTVKGRMRLGLRKMAVSVATPI